MHTSVLLEEALTGLGVKRGGKYIDATVGEGGHIKKILKAGGNVLGIDWDKEQIDNLKSRFSHKNLKLVSGNFAEIEQIARKADFFPADGILFDLGLSYSQMMNSGRGFSYMRPDESLDMRINLENETKAEVLVNSLSEDELYEIFAKNAEEINSRAIARALVGARRLKRVKTVRDLLGVVKRAVGREDKKINARVFQALRIEVNNEFENLRKGLKGAVNLLKSEGRIVVITFHSLEDRIVKKFITQNRLEQISKNKGGSSDFERSATLRAFRKQNI